MNKYIERVYNGVIKENPTFVLMLGMCPTLAVTTSAINGLGMGLTTTAVLVMSNALISLLRNFIPNKVRIPAFIAVVASFVTIIQLLLQAYIPSLYTSLGIYIPLIVVNCIILGRAEAYASKNGVGLSIFDGIGMGIGFTFGLTCLGIIREVIGSGAFFGISLPDAYTPIAVFSQAPGAFLVLACLCAIQNKLGLKSATNVPNATAKNSCGCDCLNCHDNACVSNKDKITEAIEAEKAAQAAAKAAKVAKAAEESANKAE